MPPYWKTFYPRRKRWYRWRRNRFLRWRARKPLQRTRRRRTRYRRYKVKRLFPKKRKFIKLKQWNPASIRKCKIVGFKCLLQGSPLRAQHNYVQYMYSTVPTNTPGGGAWSLMVFSLGSLYEDYDHLFNIWTASNAALPLVRYTGCKIKLYQSQHTDYIFKYDRCWPMVDTPHTHADSSPSRMLQTKHKVVMPSLDTRKRRKPYKTIKIKPPHEMQNKWYFQKDICNLPLLMTTTTAVSLTNPFACDNSWSNNITFKSLNTFIFQNMNFQHFPQTVGYSHKNLQGFSMFLYATHNNNKPTTDGESFKNWLGTLRFLGNTKENKAGQEINTWNENKIEYWGNPFFHEYLEDTPETSFTIYTSRCTILNVYNKCKNSNNPTDVVPENFQAITGPITYTLIYNPMNDTGYNKIYLIDTTKSLTFDEPENKNLIFEGFPMYNLIWGWTDFIKKLKIITNLDNNALLAIKTKNFSDTTLNVYIPIDQDFLDGYDPYQPHTHETHKISNYNYNNWYPKITFQEQTINELALTGPGCPRPLNNTYLQCLCKYYFYFKWGGCPKQLEKAYDPCLQSKWTTADNLEQRITIQNPNQQPQTELYYFDWDSDFIKKTAIERIQQYTEIDETLFSPTETKWSSRPLKTQEKDTSNEEEANLFLQLHKLRHQRLQLELKCRMKMLELKSQSQK
nr:MAG: ORF1 [TTV-like mini virus]